MANIGDIFYTFRGDGAKLQADAVKEGTKAGTTLGTSMIGNIKKSWSGSALGQGLVQGLGIAGAFGAVNLVSGAVGKLTDFIGDSIKAASDFNETVQKSGVVFGKSEGDIETWGKTAARSMGLSENAAIAAAASIGNLLLSTGTAPEKLAPMSKSIVQLASDLASFNNISVEDALAKLQSGLVGQERPLRELGVAISAASVDSEALALGFRKVNGVFTEGEKVQARYSLIFKQTTTAQGDFARTATGAANQQRILTAEFEDFSVKIGQDLLPVLIEVQTDLLKIVDALNSTGDAAKNNADPLINIGNLLHDLFKKPNEDPRTFLGALSDGLTQLDNNVGDSAAAINDFWTFWDDHSNLAARRAERLGTTFTDLKDTTSADMEGMRSTISRNLGEVVIATDATGDAMEANRSRIGAALARTTSSFDTQTGKMADDFAGIRGAAVRTSSSMDTQTGKMKDDFVGLAKGALGGATKVESAFDRMRQASARVRDALANDAQYDLDHAFDPLITYYQLVAAEAATSAAKRAAAAKGAGAAERQAVLEAEKAEGDLLISMARAGNTASNAYKQGVAGLKAEIATASGATRAYLQGVLDKLYAIDRLDPHVNIYVATVNTTKRSGTHPGGGGPQQFAEGGYVKGPIGTPQLVIAHAGEYVVPLAHAGITPHGQPPGMGTTNVNLTVNAGSDTSLSSARRWGQVILDEVAAGLREQTARSGAGA